MLFFAYTCNLFLYFSKIVRVNNSFSWFTFLDMNEKKVFSTWKPFLNYGTIMKSLSSSRDLKTKKLIVINPVQWFRLISFKVHTCESIFHQLIFFDKKWIYLIAVSRLHKKHQPLKSFKTYENWFNFEVEENLTGFYCKIATNSGSITIDGME